MFFLIRSRYLSSSWCTQTDLWKNRLVMSLLPKTQHSFLLHLGLSPKSITFPQGLDDPPLCASEAFHVAVSPLRPYSPGLLPTTECLPSFFPLPLQWVLTLLLDCHLSTSTGVFLRKPLWPSRPVEGPSDTVALSTILVKSAISCFFPTTQQNFENRFCVCLVYFYFSNYKYNWDENIYISKR